MTEECLEARAVEPGEVRIRAEVEQGAPSSLVEEQDIEQRLLGHRVAHDSHEGSYFVRALSPPVTLQSQPLSKHDRSPTPSDTAPT